VADAVSAWRLLAAGAVAGVEVEFVGADGVIQRGPRTRCWNLAFERVAPVGGLRRSAGSATGRACAGSPVPVTTWGMSPG